MTTPIALANLNIPFSSERIDFESEVIDIAEENGQFALKKRKAIEDGKRFGALVSRIAEQAARLDALPTDRSNADRQALAFDPDALPEQALRMQTFTDTLQELDALNQKSGKAFDLFEGSARALVGEPGLRNSITDRDLNDQVEQALDGLKNDWLNHYQEALGKYTEFFAELNAIMADLHRYVKASDDGQKVEIEFDTIKIRLYELAIKYQGDDGKLASLNSEADAKKFIESLGVSGLIIEQSEGKWHVKYDLGPLVDLVVSMPSAAKVTWDMMQYNAWQSGKDSRIEELQHISKVLGEKASRNLQIYDSVVKALSSLVEGIGQVNRDIVSNF